MQLVKLKVVEDIYNIHTLGFRGEAFSLSIASVSVVNLRCKPENQDFGDEISIEGGEKLSVKELGINKGTIIEVKDLFFNVPARKKFLKSASREGSLINDIIYRIALANPNISFKLFNNDKKIFHTYGNGNLKDVIQNYIWQNYNDNILLF